MKSFIIASLLVYPVYTLTQFPNITGGDSGELLSEGCLRGVPHPPGYPLYTMLINFLFRFPLFNFQSIAWNGNHLSCICGSIAAGFISETIYLLCQKKYILISVASALMYAFSPLTWEYSVGAEVFAMNNMFASLILFLAVKYAEEKKSIWLYTGSFCCGIGLTNQHTLVLFEIPLILWVLYRGKDHIIVRDLISVSFYFLLGLTPYTYLWYASLNPAKGSWGNTSNLQGFLLHLFRVEYGTFRLSPLDIVENQSMFQRIGIYMNDLLHQFQVLGVCIIVVGIFSGFFSRPLKTVHKSQSQYKDKKFSKTKMQKKISNKDQNIVVECHSDGLMLFSTYAFYILVFHSLSNIPLNQALPRAVHSRFWMQPNVICAVWYGIGLAYGRIPKLNYSIPSRYTDLLRNAISITLIILQLQHHYPHMDFHEKGDVLHSFGISLLKGIPKNSLLLSHTDINWNTIRYLQECEGHRPDITHLNFQLMPYPWFERQHQLYKNVTFPPILPNVSTTRQGKGNTELILRFIESNIDQFPHVFMDLHAINDAEIQNGGQYFQFKLVPMGMLWEVYRPSKTPSIKHSTTRNLKLLKKYTKSFSSGHARNFSMGSWEFVALTVYYDGIYQHGLHLLSYWIDQTKNIAENTLKEYIRGIELAVEALQVVYDVSISDKPSVTYPEKDILKNTALGYMRLSAGYTVIKQSRQFPISKSLIHQAYRQSMKYVKKYTQVVPDDPNASNFKSFLEKLSKDTSE